jgi:hypothetical protein
MHTLAQIIDNIERERKYFVFVTQGDCVSYCSIDCADPLQIPADIIQCQYLSDIEYINNSKECVSLNHLNSSPMIRFMAYEVAL